MLSLAPATVLRHRPPIMADVDDQSEQALLGRAVAALRARAKLNQSQAGEAFGTTGQGWAKYENGRAPTIFRPDVQRRLAEALGFSLADLQAEYQRVIADVGGRPAFGRPSALRRSDIQLVSVGPGLLIRETIQAGAWLDAEDLGWEEQKRFPAAADPRFPAEAQCVAPVRGDSMDLARIYDGDFAHLVDITAIGYSPVNSDIVEVERTRFGGQVREYTLKKIEVTEKGTVLWPCSSNKRWSEPLDLREGVPLDEDIQVRVRGKLLNVIRRF